LKGHGQTTKFAGTEPIMQIMVLVTQCRTTHEDQRSQMIAGQEKGKSLDHTKDKQLDDDSLKMAADDQDNAKYSGGLIIFNLFSLLIMFVMLFLFSRQQLAT